MLIEEGDMPRIGQNLNLSEIYFTEQYDNVLKNTNRVDSEATEEQFENGQRQLFIVINVGVVDIDFLLFSQTTKNCYS